MTAPFDPELFGLEATTVYAGSGSRRSHPIKRSPRDPPRRRARTKSKDPENPDLSRAVSRRSHESRLTLLTLCRSKHGAHRNRQDIFSVELPEAASFL